VQLTRARVLGLFYLLCLGGSGTMAFGFTALGGQWQSALGRSVAALYGFPVLLATVVVQGMVMGQGFIEPLGLNLRVRRVWWGALGIPFLALLVGVLAAALFFGADVPLSAADILAHRRAAIPPSELAAFDAFVADNPPEGPLALLLFALPAGLTFGMALALVQEIGFRGFLYREVGGGFWRRSLVIGALWGIWMVPLGPVYFPGEPLVGGVLVVLFCLLFSPSLVYLRTRAASLVPVAVAHGMLGSLTNVAAELSYGAPAWAQPPFGVSGLLGLAVVLGVLFVLDRRDPHPLMSGTQGLPR